MKFKQIGLIILVSVLFHICLDVYIHMNGYVSTIEIPAWRSISSNFIIWIGAYLYGAILYTTLGSVED